MKRKEYKKSTGRKPTPKMESCPTTPNYDTTKDPEVKTDWRERIAAMKVWGVHKDPGAPSVPCSRCDTPIKGQGESRSTSNLCRPCLDELFPVELPGERCR